jgi:hypothetical protein
MPQPCKVCHRRPKESGRHRCVTCRLRAEPIGDQVAAARARLAMVPPELRRKRTKTMQAQAPAGTAWCAGCQSFRDDADFGKGATTCRACASAKSHAAAIAKTYGLTGDDYEALLKRQGGGCAVCGGRPKSKRLAVDHDHKTGAVRGLLCSRHNHDALGALADSLAMVTALWHYLNTPPASGLWRPLGDQPSLTPVLDAAERPDTTRDPLLGIVTPGNGRDASKGSKLVSGGVLPIGAERVPGMPGIWRYYAESEAEPPF